MQSISYANKAIANRPRQSAREQNFAPEALLKLRQLIPQEQGQSASMKLRDRSAFTNLISSQSHFSKTLKGILPKAFQNQQQDESAFSKRKLDNCIDNNPQKRAKTSETHPRTALICNLENEPLKINDILNGLVAGQGKVFRLDETLLYDGAYEFEMPHGNGRSYHLDGIAIAYDGGWKNGKPHGSGGKFRPDGTLSYVGHWEEGKAHGWGRRFHSDGVTIAYEGMWEKGKFVG